MMKTNLNKTDFDVFGRAICFFGISIILRGNEWWQYGTKTQQLIYAILVGIELWYGIYIIINLLVSKVFRENSTKEAIKRRMRELKDEIKVTRNKISKLHEFVSNLFTNPSRYPNYEVVDSVRKKLEELETFYNTNAAEVRYETIKCAFKGASGKCKCKDWDEFWWKRANYDLMNCMIDDFMNDLEKDQECLDELIDMIIASEVKHDNL